MTVREVREVREVSWFDASPDLRHPSRFFAEMARDIRITSYLAPQSSAYRSLSALGTWLSMADARPCKYGDGVAVRSSKWRDSAGINPR